jgi:hypothetical protein
MTVRSHEAMHITREEMAASETFTIELPKHAVSVITLTIGQS